MLDIFFVIVRDPHLSGQCSLESGAGNGYWSTEGLDEGIDSSSEGSPAATAAST